jgi:hypothetical protein
VPPPVTTVFGRLDTAMRRRNVAILTIVVLAAIGPTAWAIWSLAGRGDGDGRPPGLLPLADPDTFPEDYRPGAMAVAAAVEGGGDRAGEFFAEVEASGPAGVVVFHLWHRSAWEPENRGATGNPGGKCRDIRYDPARGRVVEILFWQ